MRNITIIQYIKYQVERLLIKGPLYQVIFIGLLIALISFAGGQVLLWLHPTEGDISTNSWWAFLRMSDPGYLGDDNGLGKRLLATALTLLGYILFMGSLVAIMTQWLYKTMKLLESGLTPITIKGHISILNYNNRTPIIIGQLLAAEKRRKLFLRKSRNSSDKIAVLNPEVGHELTASLEDYLKSRRKLEKVIFRTGELLSLDDLGRINVENSSVIIIPSTVYGESGATNSDMKAIKSLLSIKNRSDFRKLELPRAVVEILDNEKVEIAKTAYGKNIEVVSSRVLLSRMIAQNIQNPGLSYVIASLISQGEGSEIYLKKYTSLIGCSWSSIRRAFPKSIPIGYVSSLDLDRCVINPKGTDIIDENDSLVFISEDLESIVLNSSAIATEVSTGGKTLEHDKTMTTRKVLIMGWNGKAAFLIKEMLETTKCKFEIDVISVLEVEKREKELNSLDYIGNGSIIKHIQADYTSSKDMKDIKLHDYSNIVFLSIESLNDGADADARSILGMLQVRNRLGESSKTSTFIELAEPNNEIIFAKRKGETIISPMVVSYILANVALRFELNRVFNVLFNSGGSDISFVEPAILKLSGDVSFKSISEAAEIHQMIAIGVKSKWGNEVIINPQDSTIFNDINEYKIIIIG